MPIERSRNAMTDMLYHRDRARQEARLARAARCPLAAAVHVELMRLHELRRDGLAIYT